MPPEPYLEQPDPNEVEDALIALVIACKGYTKVAMAVARQVCPAVDGITIDTQKIRQACKACEDV